MRPFPPEIFKDVFAERRKRFLCCNRTFCAGIGGDEHEKHIEVNGEVWFSSRSPRFREFSNSYLSPFVLDGETWSCVEQYYQCAKFNRGTEPYDRIRAQERPGA